MEAMDARRLRLYELLKPKLDEEPARELVLALPADPDRLATRDDLNVQTNTFNARIENLEARIDARFAQVEARFGQMEGTLTRRMVAILGGWSVVIASAFAWAQAVIG